MLVVPCCLMSRCARRWSRCLRSGCARGEGAFAATDAGPWFSKTTHTTCSQAGVELTRPQGVALFATDDETNPLADSFTFSFPRVRLQRLLIPLSVVEAKLNNYQLVFGNQVDCPMFLGDAPRHGSLENVS